MANCVYCGAEANRPACDGGKASRPSKWSLTGIARVRPGRGGAGRLNLDEDLSAGSFRRLTKYSAAAGARCGSQRARDRYSYEDRLMCSIPNAASSALHVPRKGHSCASLSIQGRGQRRVSGVAMLLGSNCGTVGRRILDDPSATNTSGSRGSVSPIQHRTGSWGVWVMPR